MPETPERDPQTVARVKRDATQRLLAIPNVVAVGIGQKVIGDEHTGEPAIKVFVRKKLPLGEVPPEEIIPPSIDGVLTDVEIGGDIVPIADPAPVDRPGVFGIPLVAPDTSTFDNKTYRPVDGGAQITTVGSNGHGTGGCLLWEPGNHDTGYVLTCMHVVQAPDVTTVTKGVTKVGQPAGSDSSSKCCNDVIGTFAGGGKSGVRDEALVKLSPGMKWRPQIADIGVVAGQHPLIPADIQVAGHPYKVAKRGMRTRVTGGTITALDTTTAEVDNLITVKPNAATGSGTSTVYFAIEGDSGSALVNASNEVVGLVFSRDDVGNGYAYSITRVLARLAGPPDNVTVEVAHTADANEVRTQPGGTFTEVPAEIAERIAADPNERAAFTGTGDRAPLAAPWFADIVPSPGTVASVLVNLHGSAPGRLLLDLWDRHGAEARDLVAHDRRVLLAWHRGGGAALMQLMLRLPGDPARALPETLNGRPLMDCVDAIAAALTRAGSPDLGTALARARTALPDLAGLTYSEIVAELRAAAGVEELIVDG